MIWFAKISYFLKNKSSATFFENITSFSESDIFLNDRTTKWQMKWDLGCALLYRSKKTLVNFSKQDLNCTYIRRVSRIRMKIIATYESGVGWAYIIMDEILLFPSTYVVQYSNYTSHVSYFYHDYLLFVSKLIRHVRKQTVRLKSY